MRTRWLLTMIAAAACSPAPDEGARCERSSPGAPWLAFASLRAGDYGIEIVRADGTCRRSLASSPSMEVHPAWSRGGVVGFTSNRSGALRIWMHDLATDAEELLDTGDLRATSPAFSPDGSTVAFEGRGSGAADTDIYVIPAGGGTPTALAAHAAADSGPAWSPDGSTIYFVSTRSGGYEIHSVAVETGEVSKLTTGSQIVGRPVVSPAGDRLYFARIKAGSSSTEVVRLVLATGAVELVSSRSDSDPSASPAGDRLALRTFRNGNAGAQLVLVDEADGGSATPITDDPASSDGSPVFEPGP